MTLSWKDRHNQRHTDQTTVNGAHILPLPTPPTLNGHRREDTDAYAHTALERETAAVATAPEGTRNHTLNVAAFNLGQLVAAGALQPRQVEQALTTAAQSAGLPIAEIRRTIASGLKGGYRSGPRTITPLPALGSVTETTIDELTGEITERKIDFWQARPQHQIIHDTALARMTSPWAVLGVVILRVLATVPTAVVLPPLIGGPGSLNLFAALVGPSGVGKGAAETCATDACRLNHNIHTAPVGSGEGIAHQYAHRERHDIIRDRSSVLFSVPEVDTLTALGGRQGATLLSQLRSAFSGERLGFGYADPQKRIPIERHSYRLGMIVGVQPEKAAPLLNDSDGGTPQRFIWMPAVDAAITDQPPIPPDPWRVPSFDWGVLKPDRNGYRIMPIPNGVAAEIRANHAARARGEGTSLDGHALFAREKVAAALAVLDGRPHLTDDDWLLAGIVMRVSDHTRTTIQHTLATQRRKAEEARTAEGVRRAVATSQAVEDANLQRIGRSLLRHIQLAGEVNAGVLRNKLPSRDRDYFDESIARLAEIGQISIDEQPDNRSPDGIARTLKPVTG